MAQSPWDTPEFKKWWAGGGQKAYMDQGGALANRTIPQMQATFSGMGYGGGYGGSVGHQQAAAAAYQPQQFAGPNAAAKQQAAQDAWQQQQAAQQPMPGVAPGGGGGGTDQYTGNWGNILRMFDENPDRMFRIKGQEKNMTREDLVARMEANPYTKGFESNQAELDKQVRRQDLSMRMRGRRGSRAPGQMGAKWDARRQASRGGVGRGPLGGGLPQTSGTAYSRGTGGWGTRSSLVDDWRGSGTRR